MATESTPLLKGCVITMPKDASLPMCGDLMKGLSLEELMPFDNDPWWQNMRRITMTLFWTVLFVILTAACIIAVTEHNQGHCSAKSNVIKRQIVQGLLSPNGTSSTATHLVNTASVMLALWRTALTTNYSSTINLKYVCPYIIILKIIGTL